MQTIYNPTIILPESISDDKLLAAKDALDKQLKKISTLSKQTLHLPRIDELTGTILDILAEQFHVDFFDAVNLSDAQKRKLIRQSIEHHRLKGTRYAVEQVVAAFFKSGEVEELGNFLFRIKTTGFDSTPETFPTFMRMLEDAKNVRSHLADIELDLSDEEPQTIYGGNALWLNGVKTFAPDMPKNQIIKLSAGTAFFVHGMKTYAPDMPKNQIMRLAAGNALGINGSITIDTADAPTFPNIKENPIADLLIADIGIARGSYYFNPIDLDKLEFNSVKIFFGFPLQKQHRRYRGILMPNARTDLTREEIKEVGQYAIDNKIVMNARGEIATKVIGAALKTKTIEKIVLPNS